MSALITDDQSLVSAKGRFGHAIKTYDDGYGKLYIHRDSMGISGIVRAQSWEDAYGICEDEFFPEATETLEEIRNEYNFTRKTVKMVFDRRLNIERQVEDSDYVDGKLPTEMFTRWQTIETPCEEDCYFDNELFQEAFGFRPNGGMYEKDLNGDSLDALTPELLAELEITLVIHDEDGNPVELGRKASVA